MPAWGLVDPILGLNFFKEHAQCQPSKNYLYLNKDKMRLFERKLGVRPGTSIFKRYELKCEDIGGSVYIMNGLVRSQYMTLLVYTANEQINEVEVINFSEPGEYKPKQNWLLALAGKSFSKNIEVDGISGATLTTQTTKNLLNQVKVMENYFHDKK
jgi:hypothetical protein